MHVHDDDEVHFPAANSERVNGISVYKYKYVYIVYW